jgi:hypothetical protein
MKIGILIVCTGKYNVFLDTLYRSCEQHFLPQASKTYYVFTEGPVPEYGNIIKFHQPYMGFPNDTLKRFHLFTKYSQILTESDYLYFLNANMICVREIGNEILPTPQHDHLFAVQHPGFYNKPATEFTYERNPTSRFHIPMGEGSHYYQGCFIGGRTPEFLGMSQTLASLIDIDLAANVMPVWWDESALNWYMKDRKPLHLNPGYAYPEGWKLPFTIRLLQRDKNRFGGHAFLRKQAIGTQSETGSNSNLQGKYKLGTLHISKFLRQSLRSPCLQIFSLPRAPKETSLPETTSNPVHPTPQAETTSNNSGRLQVEFKDSNFDVSERKPRNFDWVKTSKPVDAKTFVSDVHIPLHSGGVAWLVEPPAIHPEPYDWIKKNHNRYRYVLTFSHELLSKGANFLYYPFGNTLLSESQFGLYTKNKQRLVSMMLSNKKFTEGHRFRHTIRAQVGNRIDLLGSGATGVHTPKIAACRDYFFQITVENSKYEHYFTEKILDCFLTGVIPIYWGTADVLNLFDKDGIIMIDEKRNINDIVDSITPDLYHRKIKAVERNFKLAQKYVFSEDWIFDNYGFLF